MVLMMDILLVVGGNDGAFLEKTIQQMSYKSDEYIKGMREGWNEGYDDYLKYGNK